MDLSRDQTALRRRAPAVAAAMAAGLGLAGQARLNGTLGAQLGDGIAAPLISTTVGLAVLIGLTLLQPGVRRGLALVRAALRAGELRWWQCSGGISGALFVAAQGISVATIGVAVFSVATVAGSAVGSLAADHWAMGPTGRHPLATGRVAGAVVCVGAVAMAVADRFGSPTTLALVALPLLAGVTTAVQFALNGRVGAAAASPWPATVVNFAVAWLTLGIVVLVGTALHGLPPSWHPFDPLLCCAGLIGIGVIAAAAYAVRTVGVLIFGLGSVAGQLCGALAIDTLTPQLRPSVGTWIGAAVAVIAALLVARRHR